MTWTIVPDPSNSYVEKNEAMPATKYNDTNTYNVTQKSKGYYYNQNGNLWSIVPDPSSSYTKRTNPTTSWTNRSSVTTTWTIR